MRPTATLNALLADLQPGDLTDLAPAHLRRLADLAYHVHIMAQVAAAEAPYPRVRRAQTPQRREPKSGLLLDLQGGRQA